MLFHPHVFRYLLISAGTLPLALFVLEGSTTHRETDLQIVYNRLSDQTRYQDLNHWCGLRVSEATLEEAAQLREAVENHADPSQVWCGHLDAMRRNSPPRTYRFPEGIRWYRLGDPWSPSRWIGIGVYDEYNTARTTPVIRCRFPIGFDPNG